MRISGILAATLTVATALWLVPLFHERLGNQTRTAQWVVLFLGLEVAFSLFLTIYGAIIVGCHRWDIHNATSAVSYALMTVGMIVAILLGAGLPTLALVHLLCMTSADVVRWRLAARVCPEFVMDYRLADWSTWKEQAKFSAKSLVPRIADLISNQSLALLITAFLGPAMLAIYSRPRNLMRQGQTITAKFGSILVPAASSLDAQAGREELRKMFLRSASYISSLTMPAVVALAVVGDEVIRIWMGRGYMYPGLVPILAIGCFPSLVQEPVWGIISGMNCHGRLALWKLGGAVCSCLLLVLGLAVFHWHLLAAALAFALPQAAVDSIIAPVVACRLLDTPPFQYYKDTYFKPMLPTLLFAGLVLSARLAFGHSPVACVISLILAVGVIVCIYWSAFATLQEKSTAS